MPIAAAMGRHVKFDSPPPCCGGGLEFRYRNPPWRRHGRYVITLRVRSTVIAVQTQQEKQG